MLAKNSKYFQRVVVIVTVLFASILLCGNVAFAETVPDYDVDAAVKYAENHYDDYADGTNGSGDCIQFVRECFEAGGVPRDVNRKNPEGEEYGYTVKGYVEYITNNGYGVLCKLTTEKQEWTNPQWYVVAEDNEDVFSVGDGVIYVCDKCGAYFHASIYTGINEDGFAKYYAQNKAVADKPLCTIKCYSCSATKENISLYSLHITSKENGYVSTYNNKTVTGLTVERTGAGTLEISWNAASGADGYKVFMKSLKAGAYNQILDTTKTKFTYSEKTAGANYYFTVRPYYEVGDKCYIGKMCDMVWNNEKIDAPEVTIYTVTSTGKPKIKWNAVNGAVKYEVFRATSANGTFSRMGTVTSTYYTHEGAKAGTKYYYKVRAITEYSTANSEYSDVVSITCDCAQPKVTVTNVASTGKPKVTWKAIAGAEKYEVYRATSKDGTYTKLTTTKSTSYTHTGAKAGKTYYYKVKAICSNSAGNSKYSTIQSITCDCAQPKVSASVVASSGKPKLTWSAVAGAEKYEIYRATSKNGTYTKLTTTKKTSYTHTGAKKGKTYYYKVKAICATSSKGNSAFSNVVYKTAKK